MQNSVIVFTFFFFGLDFKHPALGELGPKTQNCQFKLKFSIWTYLNMQILMVVFTLSVLNYKHFRLDKFGPKNQKLSV